MEKTYKAPESSEFYRKIYALDLTPACRAQALAALGIAERLVDAAMWLVGKFAKSASTAPARGTAACTKLKHQ